ncbi:MAG: PDZ domain-containing protein [Planctomycetota bacterium]
MPWITRVCGAEADVGIAYRVELGQANNHYVEVELTATAKEAETILMMPVWTPGSYLIREHARHLDSLRGGKEDGTELSVRKTRKNRWRVQTEPGTKFVVSYRLYCNDVSVRTNFVNEQFAVLNGAATFLTVLGQLSAEHHVALTLPSHWNGSATSLTSQGGAHRFVARNFDELVDSPIVAGRIDVFPFDVDGVPHQLVNVGQTDYWDGAKAAADLAVIVQQQRDFWGGLPYDRYLFLNVIGEGRGGLEHDRCCLLLTSRWNFRIPESYEDWLSLASHEFFHAWNVRRLRPTSLLRYDYEKETYTGSLWIAEGITSYYEDVFLVRSGLIDEEAYLERLSKNIETTQITPGRRVQSLRDASFDTWIKFYRPDENRRNTRVSYYSKGAVVAFLLDAEIRSRTDNERSLDDAMRLAYRRFVEAGFSEEEFRDVINETVGDDLSSWFRSMVDDTDELQFGLALQWYGLRWDDSETDTNTDDDDPDGEDEDGEESKPERWLGIEMDGDKVSIVLDDSPAANAGVSFDDQILAINGFQLHGSLEEHLEQFEVGDQISLLVSRRGELQSIDVTIAPAPKQSWTLVIDDNGPEASIQNRESWIGQR